ncbi:lanthionine synthetase LanC family protein [Elizabethkingia occulta]|uniref:lanthionine synthetase LanC family protein n=1 Tax=Elizabethkingia occulta TaxID=1867263 RepID=UPI00398C2706
MISQIDTDEIVIQIGKELDINADIFSDASIEYGEMGAALFYYYYQSYFDDDNALLKAESAIEKSIDMLSKISFENQNPLKFNGDSISLSLSSFGKGLLFIQSNFEKQYDFSENYSYLSDVLDTMTDQSLKRKDYDYFSGSLAPGYYFLNQYKYSADPMCQYVLHKIVDSILENAVNFNKDEVYWKSPVYNNQIYLGLSHGSAMIINFLTKITELKVCKEDCEEIKNIVYKAILFVLNRERYVSNGIFPHKHSPRESYAETQLSMCYGDLGILYAINNAIKIFDFKEFDEKIQKLLFVTSKRKLDKTHTQDASILYGCSGLYYIYKEIYNRTYDKAYLASCEYWYQQIFSFRNPEKKTLAGFQFEYEDDRKVDGSAKFSFLWGLSGIGITLMQGSNKSLPQLNELLLI